jgi:hypothetical protein
MTCSAIRWNIGILTIPAAGSATPTQAKIWLPKTSDQLQIQFSGKFEYMDHVEIYDLDLFDTSPEIIKMIHARGQRAFCYINAGAWENWRPDATQYPADTIGKDYEGWPGEKWLDIRQIGQLEPIVNARLDLCREKGFDGVEPDNLDGYQNETGFLLSANDQMVFNRWLASQAHIRGLAIGLKNDPDQMDVLEPDFDFVIMEDCFQGNWCDSARSFIENNKPAFAVEYTDRTKTLSHYCEPAKQLGVSLLLKNRNLDAYREACF